MGVAVAAEEFFGKAVDIYHFAYQSPDNVEIYK